MAVGFSAVGVGAADWGDFDTAVGGGFDLSVNNGDCILAGMDFSAADLQILFYHDDNNITDLTRTVLYGDTPLTSLGFVQWDTAQAWTEVFAIMGVSEGKRRLSGKVSGGASSKRYMRISALTYSGVDSIGPIITGSGNGTAMTISTTAQSTAQPADRLVGVFGTRSGISAYNGQRRYLDNSGIGLVMGDAPGTGSVQAVTATRQKAGQWGGILVPLNAADTIATCPPIPWRVGFGPVSAHREPRMGGLRRQTFKVPLEAEGKYVAIADPKAPNDVTSIALDWTDWLEPTKDRIKDGRIFADGLDKKDDSFTFTDQTVVVGGGTANQAEEITYYIETWNGESYSRTIKLPIKNL